MASTVFFSITPLEEFSLTTGAASHPERSKYNELYFVGRGYMVREMNLHTVRLNANELHLSLEKQITSVQTFGEGLQGFCCRFSNEFLEQLQLKDDAVKSLLYINSFMYRYPLRLAKPAAQRVSHAFSTLYGLSRRLPYGRELMAGYLSTILLEAKEVLLQIDQDSPSSKPFLIVKQYHDLLAQYITSHRDLEFYAAQLGISPNHLNKSVKRATGETAVELRNKMTLLEAKLQLRQSHLPVSEIAYRLGFHEQSYFSRFFKNATGLSPIQYREL